MAHNRRTLRASGIAVATTFVAVAVAGVMTTVGGDSEPLPEAREPSADGPVEGVAIVENDYLEPGERSPARWPMTGGDIVAIPRDQAEAVTSGAEPRADEPAEVLRRDGIAHYEDGLAHSSGVVRGALDDQGRFTLDTEPGSYLLCPLLASGMAAGCAEADLTRGRQLELWWNEGDVWVAS